MSDNKKIDQVGSFTYLGSIICKGGGCIQDLKNKTAKAQGVFSQLKTSLGKYEDKSANQD